MPTTDSDDFFPLGVACSGGHYDVVRILIANGADVNMSGRLSDRLTYNRRHGCLGEAIAIGNLAIAQELIKHGANIGSMLLVACTAVTPAQIDLIRLLLDSGADINRLGKNPYDHRQMATCLSVAIFFDCKLALICELIDRGANADGIPTPAQWIWNCGNEPSPLRNACVVGRLDLVHVLEIEIEKFYW